MTKQILSVRPARTGQTENPSVGPVFAYPGPARFFAFPEIRGHRRQHTSYAHTGLGFAAPSSLSYASSVAPFA